MVTGRNAHLFYCCRHHWHIYGKYSSYDFRSTFATQLMDHGLTTKQAADHMGHADSRMIERIYARTRTESVMKRQDLIEQMNAQFASK